MKSLSGSLIWIASEKLLRPKAAICFPSQSQKNQQAAVLIQPSGETPHCFMSCFDFQKETKYQKVLSPVLFYLCSYKFYPEPYWKEIVCVCVCVCMQGEGNAVQLKALCNSRFLGVLININRYIYRERALSCNAFLPIFAFYLQKITKSNLTKSIKTQNNNKCKYQYNK